MLSLLQGLHLSVLLLQGLLQLLETVMKCLWTTVTLLLTQFTQQRHSLVAELHQSSDLGEVLNMGCAHRPRGRWLFPWKFLMGQIQATALLQVR